MNMKLFLTCIFLPKGKFVYSSGGVYDGDWENDERKHGKMEWATGDVYEGEF